MTDKKRIAIWSSYSFETGYAEYHIMECRIRRLLERGAEVLLIQKSFEGENSVPESLKNNPGLVSVAVPFDNTCRKSFVRRYLSELAYYIRSFRYVPRKSAVFIQSGYAAWMPVMLNRIFKPHNKIIYNVQDVFPENAAASDTISEKSIMYRIFYRLQTHSYRWADSVITISEDMRDTLLRHKVAEDKVRVIHNWSSYDGRKDSGRQNAYTEKEGLPPDEFRVVYAGNIGVMQNVMLILRASERLTDTPVRFYIVGDGVERDNIAEYKSIHGLDNVRMLLATSESDAWDVYNMADINIIPLVPGGIYTAFPSKTAACLQSGRQIIMCIDGESKTAKHYADCPQCTVVSANDADALADAIRQAYADREKIRESCCTRSADSEIFSEKINCGMYIEHILEMLE